MNAATRLGRLKRQLLNTQPRRSYTSTGMAKAFDLNSKYRLLSGYEIPILGYGVGGVRSVVSHQAALFHRLTATLHHQLSLIPFHDSIHTICGFQAL